MVRLLTRSSFATTIFVLCASAVADAASLTLEWNPRTDSVTVGYYVTQRTGTSSQTTSTNVGMVTQYRVDGLADDTQYCFAVRAYNNAGQTSILSTEVCGTTPPAPPPYVPPAPYVPPVVTPSPVVTPPAVVPPVVTPPAAAPAAPAAPPAPVTPAAPAAPSPAPTAPAAPSPAPAAPPASSGGGAASGSGGGAARSTSTPPSGPASSSASPGSGVTASFRGRFLDLTWSGGERGGASGYRVEVGRGPGETSLSAFTNAASSTMDLSNLESGSYQVRIRPVSNGAIAEAMSETTITLDAGPAPTQFTATREGANAHLAWQPPSDGQGAGSYEVEVGSSSGAADVATARVASLSAVIRNFAPATYYMRVRAVRGGIAGPPSEELTLTIASSSTACVAAPGAPMRFAATAIGTAVNLSWQRGNGEAPTGYLLQVGSAPGRYELMNARFGGAETSLRATAANGTYALRLAATNACGTSAWGPETILNVGAPPAASSAALPGAPVGLAQQVAGQLVTLTWSAPAEGGVTRYQIEATTPAGPVVFDTGNPATVFSNANTPSGQYVIKVRAGNAAGFGAASTEVTVVVP